jgi:hypothetical protein
MKSRRIDQQVVVLGAFLCAFLALVGSGEATSFLIPRDDVLVRQAPVIAEVSVMSVSPSPAEGAPSTDYIVLVERLLKGRVSGTSVVVRVPGGVGVEGLGLKVHGAPVFSEGDNLVLFLVARATVSGQTRDVALRNLIGSADRSSHGGLIDAPRDWEAFTVWLANQSAGIPAEENYFLSSEDVDLDPLPVRLDPLPIAWERFAQGRRVRWRSKATSGPRRQLLKGALEAWSSSDATSVRLRPAKGNGVAAGLTHPDGVNDVVFGDPAGVMAGSFSCQAGGIAAVSASWFDPGVTFRFRPGPDGLGVRIKEAEVVFNDGAECLLRRSSGIVAKGILNHEIGHTLGLDHSGEPGSPMFPEILGRGDGPIEGSAGQSRLEKLYPPRLRSELRRPVADSSSD